jgi:GntR family transcriptional repressor for pyruvate dehydrogenase complex
MSGARERLARDLIADVAESRLRPGDPLPGDDELAQRFGVSRETARHAVIELADRGIAQVAPNGAAIVGPEAHWDVLDPGVLEVLLESAQGPAILAEYLEFRRLVEVVAAGMAADHATTADLAALSDALARMTAAPSETDFHRADVEFHHALIAAGRNPPLERAADPLKPALCTARRLLARPERRQERGLPEHQRILTAVAQGDANGARAAMTAHLDTIESYLREYAGLSGCGSESSGRPDER